MKRLILCVATISIFLVSVSRGQESDPMDAPPITSFLAGGFGELHPKAPPETAQFGQLVGIWRAEAEIRAGDGSWRESAPGYWAWKYAIDGFAVRDLWY